jgi:GNAT superfamily N-acetyltransferase
MNLREYIPEDHPMLTAWWKAHGFPVLPAAILPKLGIVAEHDGVPVCAAFLYMDNSVGVCMLEWLTTNPQAPGKHVPGAIRALVGFMAERAGAMNYGVMLTTCRQEALARVYEKNGFTRTDDSVIHLLKVIPLNPEN